MDGADLLREFEARRSRLWQVTSAERICDWIYRDFPVSAPVASSPNRLASWSPSRREAVAPPGALRRSAMALAGWYLQRAVPMPGETAGKHWVLTVRGRGDLHVARLTVGQCEAFRVTWSTDDGVAWARLARSPLSMAERSGRLTSAELVVHGIEAVRDPYKPFAHDAACFRSARFDDIGWLLSQPAAITAARLMNARLSAGPFPFASLHDPDIVAEAWAAARHLLVTPAAPRRDGAARGFDQAYTDRRRPGLYPDTQPAGGEDHERADEEHHQICLRVIGVVGADRIGAGLNTVPVDLAWRDPRGRQYVSEVKSCTAANATDQLRAGLGQLIEYRHRLSQCKIATVVLLIVSHVYDSRWYAICADVDVQLVAIDNTDDLNALET